MIYIRTEGTPPKWVFMLIHGIFLLVITVFALSLLLVKFLWAWTIPDLFPGAVQQGLVARSISWFSALKVAIFIAILTAVAGAKSNKE